MTGYVKGEMWRVISDRSKMFSFSSLPFRRCLLINLLFYQVGFLSEAQVGGYSFDMVLQVVSNFNFPGLVVEKFSLFSTYEHLLMSMDYSF